MEENTQENNVSYSSETGGEIALLAKDGDSIISNATVVKSGDESSENSDFFILIQKFYER